MQQSASGATGTGVRWTLVVSLSVPAATLDARGRTCREIWAALAARAEGLGLDAPGGGIVRTRRGAVVLVGGESELAAALVERGAVTSIVAYELRERLGIHA